MICSIASTGFEKITQKEKYIKRLRAITELMYFKGCRDFCIAALPGIPLWTAGLICDMKKYLRLSLRIYSPREGNAAGLSPEQRELFYSVRKRADSFICLSREHTESCYNDSIRAIVDVCDILILIDGPADVPCDRSVLKYAREKGVRVIYEIIE